MDKVSLQRIELLHPLVREEAKKILQECDQALTGSAKVRFTHTLRTFQEQADLYALGRTKVNPDGKSSSRPMGYKVTNAQAGSSIHNYALAIDICLIINGKEASWNDVKDFDGDGLSDWMEVVRIFKKYGWTWGGSWSSFVDKPHFEKTFGYSLAQLKSKYNAKDFIQGTNFVNLKVMSSNQKRTTSALNLRECAGTDKKILLVIPSGEIVTVKNTFGDWSEVNFGSKTGFVSTKYLI